MKEEQVVKKFQIPIFTEEYKVCVVVGSREKIKKELVKYTEYSPIIIERDFIGRGIAYDLFPDKHPIIAIDGSLPVAIAFATIAHESIHAVNFIIEYLGITDRDEFLAHSVSAILRVVYDGILKNN